MRAHWSSVSSWNRDTIPGFQNPAGKFIRHALGVCHCLNDTSNQVGPDSSIVGSPRGIVKNESLRGFPLIGTGGAVIACSEHESKHCWLKRPVRANGQWPDCEV